MLIACLYRADMLLKNDAGLDEGVTDQLSDVISIWRLYLPLADDVCAAWYDIRFAQE